MKKREEEMLLQNENKAIQELKEQLKQEPVPAGLRPDGIKEALTRQQETEEEKNQSGRISGKKPFYKRRGWVAAAACILLAAVVLGIPGLSRSLTVENDKPSHKSAETAAGSAGESGSSTEEKSENSLLKKTVVSDVAFAEDYEQLFQLFRQQGLAAPDKVFTGYAESKTAETAGAVGYDVSSEDVAFDGAGTGAEVSSAAQGAAQESSRTNVQEEGIDEADIIKTDGRFIYILQENENALRVVQAVGGQLTECENHLFVPEKEESSIVPIELYVADGAVTVISQCRETIYYNSDFEEISPEEAKPLLQEQEKLLDDFSRGFIKEYTCLCFIGSREYVKAESFSVDENGALRSLGAAIQDGNYSDSRKVDDIIYLFTDYYPQIYHEDGSVIREYVPSINGNCISPDYITMPEEASDSYIVCSSFRTGDPKKTTDLFAVLNTGYGITTYVSENAVYFASVSHASDEEEKTQIIKYRYQDGVMTAGGTCEVFGRINDSFSMDEHNGYLRLATTGYYEKNRYVQYANGVLVKASDSWFEGSVAEPAWIDINCLYVLDENLNLTGSIEGLAEGETIQSARFMGDTGYFVTYQNTDPLFSVDLSDPANPKIVGELKIPGFSSYLHFYSGSLLLGLGQETDPETGELICHKLSMFDISDPYQVKEIDKYLVNEQDPFDYCEALYNHKALLIDPKKDLIGFACNGETIWDGDGETEGSDSAYRIFGYGPDGFYLKFTFEQSCYRMRGIYIGDVLYICSWLEKKGEIITAFDMADGYRELGSITLEKQCEVPEVEARVRG